MSVYACVVYVCVCISVYMYICVCVELYRSVLVCACVCVRGVGIEAVGRADGRTHSRHFCYTRAPFAHMALKQEEKRDGILYTLNARQEL